MEKVNILVGFLLITPLIVFLWVLVGTLIYAILMGVAI